VKKVKVIYQLLLGFIPKAYLETAFSAGILAYAVGVSTAFEQATAYAFFLFFATLSMYNLLRSVSLVRRIKELTLDTVIDAVHIPIHLAISAITAFVSLILLFFLSLDLATYLLLGILLMVTLLYRLKWLHINQKAVSLSDLPFLKAFLVALTWTILCAGVPSAFAGSFGLKSIAVFSYFLGLTIPFDIRDLHFDSQDRRTFPQILGVVGAQRLSIFLIALGFYLLNPTPKDNLLLLMLGLFAHFYLILKVNPQRKQVWIYRLLDLGPVLLALYLMT
jgi:hypothetical protein